MSSFMIELTDEEITHVYLAVCNSIKNNTNTEAVTIFEGILNKLDAFASDVTKMTGSIMRRF